MKRPSRIKTWVHIFTLLCMIAPARAQDTKTQATAGKPAVSRDRATELIRREAKAANAEREAVFARIRALAPPPPLPVRNVAPVPVVRPNVFVMMGNRVIVVEQVAAAIDDDADEIGLPPRPKFIVARQTFDNYVFGSGENVDSARAVLESLLTRAINRIGTERRLTPDQKMKLRMAGRGDIKRFLDRVEEERKKFEQIRMDFRNGQRFLDELLPLGKTYRNGPFDAGSLFAKTLKRMIEEDAAAARGPD